MAVVDNVLRQWTQVLILQFSCAKSALPVRVYITSFLKDTGPVSKLIGVAVWKGVSLRVKEGNRLLDGTRQQYWPEKLSRKPSSLGANDKRIKPLSPKYLLRERFNTWLRGMYCAISSP